MAFRCKEYIVELEAAVDNTVLMQELQDQADLGCVKPGRFISIDELLASDLVGAFLNYALASATKCRRLKDPELTLTLQHRTDPPEYDDSNRLLDNTLLQDITLVLYKTSR